MEGDSRLGLLLFSLFLILGNGFFVAAEYGLVGARRSRIETLSKKGNSSAKLLQKATTNIGVYIAGIQIAITMIGIAIGAITEPLVTQVISGFLGASVSQGVGIFISVILVTYILVIVGELVPKYVALQHAELVALTLIRPLHIFVTILSPLGWLVQKSGALLLRPMGIKMTDLRSSSLTREELRLLIKAGGTEGMLDEEHAQLISRALKFDQLDASDIMIHRLDIKWIDKNTPKEQLFEKLAQTAHNRVPICDEDIDNVLGILYLPDLIKHWNDTDFSLQKILRPVEAVPENLHLNKVLTRMREAQTQMLIVLDEYGGTNGLLTLEDVIEEIFGEFEDQLESERPTIERQSSHRLSARAEVRYDELLEFLNIETDEDVVTDTLANLVVKSLGRMPKLGDSVEMPIGVIRVENMVRRRITRVSIYLSDELGSSDHPTSGPG